MTDGQQLAGARAATRAIHAGQAPDPVTGAVVPPIYMTSTYVQPDVGQHKGFEYSRTDNPTRRNLETQIAALDNASQAVAFASGMAAISTMLQTLSSGDHVICVDDVYGGTYRLFQGVLARHAGLTFSFVSFADVSALKDALTERTRLVWVETPTNPLLQIVDIAAVAASLRDHADATGTPRPRLVVDNTFATSALQQPLSLGADVVAYSTTKYFGGHSDLLGGALVTSDEDLAAELRYLQNAVGAVPGPMDCWLTTRGIKTLPLRMERHCENAAAIAAMLEARDDVEAVFYPGLDSHPSAEIARRQMSAGGGMISFRPTGGETRARQIARSTRWFGLAESLGGVESLIELPGAMTHLTLDGSPLAVPADLIRLSVGIEHVDDLIADLAGALERSPVSRVVASA